MKFAFLVTYLSDLSMQTINAIFVVIPNAVTLGNSCQYFSTISDVSFYIRWSCINTVFSLPVPSQSPVPAPLDVSKLQLTLSVELGSGHVQSEDLLINIGCNGNS